MLSRFATSLAVSARFWANSWSAARSATVLPPAFSPSPRNDAAQLSGGPHGALLNHMSWGPPDSWAATFLGLGDRKSTRLNSSHQIISYAVFCLKKKKRKEATTWAHLVHARLRFTALSHRWPPTLTSACVRAAGATCRTRSAPSDSSTPTVLTK